ncbi:uncharacterized protein Tco_0762690 [Tanacetum coccineum]
MTTENYGSQNSDQSNDYTRNPKSLILREKDNRKEKEREKAPVVSTCSSICLTPKGPAASCAFGNENPEPKDILRKMLKTAVRSFTMSLTHAAGARPFCTLPVRTYEDYDIREAHPEEYSSISELRAKYYLKLPVSDPDFNYAIQSGAKDLGNFCKLDSYHCIVGASRQAENKEKSSVYGSVELWLNYNVPKCHGCFIEDPKWSTDENKDGYVTDLFVVPPSRRRHIARNMLLYAKDMAAARGMQRIMAIVEATNHPAIHLNHTVGLEVVPTPEEEDWILMGTHLKRRL